MNFSFSNLADANFTNNGTQYLRPYDVYPVNLTKIEKTKLQGKNGETSYDVVALEFKGCGENKGVYTENLFVPNKDDDFVRRNNPTSGAMYPSSFERFQYTLMQLVQVINPTGAQKIIDNAAKLKTIDQFIDLVIRCLQDKNNVEIYLKLVGRNVNGAVYSALPNSCVLPKGSTADSKPSPLNFVSTDPSKLAFSNYEMDQMKKYKNAAPTPMNDTTTKDDDAIDLDDIEL